MENCPYCNKKLEKVKTAISFFEESIRVNPIKALKELKRVAKERIIISVPKEPNFSLVRLSWNKEHLTALTEKFISFHLDLKPIYKIKFMFRWLILVYDLNE